MRSLIGVTLIVFACAAAAAHAGRESWRTHRAPQAGFSIAAPANWIDFTRATPQALRLVRVYPQLRPYLDLVRTGKAIKLVLASVTGPTFARGFATNLNVVQSRAIGDLELQRDATIAQLKGLHLVVGPIHATYVRLPAGRALKLVYHARYSQTMPALAETQFILLRAGQESVLTYTTLPSAEARYRAT